MKKTLLIFSLIFLFGSSAIAADPFSSFMQGFQNGQQMAIRMRQQKMAEEQWEMQKQQLQNKDNFYGKGFQEGYQKGIDDLSDYIKKEFLPKYETSVIENFANLIFTTDSIELLEKINSQSETILAKEPKNSWHKVMFILTGERIKELKQSTEAP